MTIKTLESSSLAEILPVFLEAFEGYFVKMPSSFDYWASRFDLAMVDLSASFGAFDKNNLVGFVIHGIDQKQGRKVAFNTGTGVLRAYRGQHLVDKMYQKALRDLSPKGIRSYELEVIVENKIAINVYRRLGFSIRRRFKCFNGEMNHKLKHQGFSLLPCTLNDCASHQLFTDYSWDFRLSVLERAAYKYTPFLVKNSQGSVVGFFVLDKVSGSVAQIDASEGNMLLVLSALGSIRKDIKISNIDSTRTELIDSVIETGLDNTIDQLEMCLDL